VTTSERGKTICFIDDSNIYHGGHAAGWRVDWARFDAYLEKSGPVWQTYFFASRHEPPTPQEEGFYEHLKRDLRWEVTLYELGRRTLRCSKCGHTETVPTEKGVDVGLAIKMLTLATNQAFETALLVAGDRDYLETVQTVKGLGLRVEVIAWREAVSHDLALESSEPVIYLDSLRKQLERD
jgi:uncharacterized LabA/DUF88 family protein